MTLGYRHSPETIVKISAARKGASFSNEHRAALSAARRGATHSPEVRAKISATQKLRLAANPPGPVSDERRAAMSTAQKGKVFSDEHRQALSAAQKLRWATNPPATKDSEQTPEIFRERHLRARFGLTVAEYTAMHDAQGGVCAICRQEETHTRSTGRTDFLAVDHDHKTGAVRGLLCRGCNMGIGNLKDNPTLLLAAVGYLEKYMNDK